MNNSKLVELDRILNDARMAADDVVGTLEHLADVYATLAASRPGGGSDEKKLSATFSTIQAQAARVLSLIDAGLG